MPYTRLNLSGRVGQTLYKRKKGTIAIFNSKGQKVLQQIRYFNKEIETVELPPLPQAVYYLQVISNKRSASGKFIKKE